MWSAASRSRARSRRRRSTRRGGDPHQRRSSVPVIDNSGAIRATISSPGQGSSYGIRDLSGTLTKINNSGFISASGTAQDVSFAIDLSANTSGVTINQTAPSGTADDASTITPNPLAQISGNIRTGSGNDVVNLGAGAIVGNSFFGDGNDTLALSRDAVYSGRADFGAGTAALSLAAKSQFFGTAIFNNNLATLTLGDTSLFRGDINGGANLSVAVNGGTLEAGRRQRPDVQDAERRRERHDQDRHQPDDSHRE